MSERIPPTTHAVSRVQSTGTSPTSSRGPVSAPSTAAGRATQGVNGNFQATEGPTADAFTATGEGSVEGNESLLSGLTSWFGGAVEKGGSAYKQATTRFNLTEEEKKQLKHGLSTLEKLAGEDRRWNSNDLADNMQQLQIRPILKPVAEAQMRRGMEEMTGQPVPKLTPEQKTAAAQRWQGLSPEQREARKFDRGDMDQFRDTMDMLKSRSTELGLPESKMPNGLSVEFLQAVLENQPGIMLHFKR